MQDVNNWLNLVFRWIHVVAGIAWIGHLYFFNFVNAHFAKTLTADNRKLVVPELMPRALFWFRMGAAWTWVTGILLLGIVYYMGGEGVRGGVLYEDPANANQMAGGVMLVVLLIFAFLYDVLMRALKAQPMIAVALSLGLLAVMYCLGWEWAGFSGRGLYVFIGGAFGTAMAMNVWMRIWPAQKRIISAVKEGVAPDADLVAMAGLRSRHNTFMSVPLVFFMVSNHFPNVYGHELHWLFAAIIIAVGFVATSVLYNASAKVKGF